MPKKMEGGGAWRMSVQWNPQLTPNNTDDLLYRDRSIHLGREEV